MFDFLAAYDLGPMQWVLVLLCAVLIGMSKAGLSGFGLLVVPLLASVFGGRPSVGLLLPMLVFADVFAVRYYNRHAEWKHVFRLLPWAMAGIIAGAWVGKIMSDDLFSTILASLVILGIVLMLYQDLRKKVVIPDYWWFSMTLGLVGGFSSMIGNAAGPVMALYLLSMRFPKNQYIGTAAWFFFIVNLSKIPFHAAIWKTITWSTLAFDVLMIPAIAIGAFLGIWIVKQFPERIYRLFIIATALIAAVLLIVR